MIKIAALNDESDEDSDSEEEVTKEALEQIALQQYAKALDLQRKGNIKDAMQLLKDLLDTELLYEVKKPGPGEKATEPLFNLKYLCHKNVAAMQSASGEVEAAIESYCAASELDDTDVTLWNRLGQLCLRAKRYDMALTTFQRGLDCNARHWPCLDKVVTLLLGLGYKEDCIVAIYDALKLDEGYLRGLVYRRHIYTYYPYIKDYMEYVDKKYKWNAKDDAPIDEEKAAKLLKEAEAIQADLKEQEKAEDFKCVLPDLRLQKPITELTWLSVGESLVHMHHYMTENAFSHACFIELVFEKKVVEEEKMEIFEEPKKVESNESKSDETNMEVDKTVENSENENNDFSDKEKAPTDTERVESDIEMIVSEIPEAATEPTQLLTESKEQKKAPARRRGSDLSFLQQWEWCNKRRSGRKPKQVTKVTSNNIYDMLRKMVPAHLVPEVVAEKDKDSQKRETSPDVPNLEKLFDEKPVMKNNEDNEEYFGSESEQRDVEIFIQTYTETKRDIIEILEKYLAFLSAKWQMKWPESLQKTYVEANKCYSQHIDVPTCSEQNRKELLHYVNVNMLAEEFSVNERHSNSSENKEFYEIAVIDTIGLTLVTKPDIFGSDCLNLMLRHLWIKLHIHLMNRNDEIALDCLYQLLHEFQAMGEYRDLHSLKVTNFTFKPVINEAEIQAYLKFLERNKYLSTVMDLYENGDYEEVLTIVKDSFEHCKDMARQQEEEMSVDFSVQLSIILDAYWALGKVDECFQASFTCLHEALKHFFHYTSGCKDHEKWSLTVVKILSCMEHILNTEGLCCLDVISVKDLSQGLEDLIRIIGHQVETKAAEMPFDTVVPWILMHYILQREEDQGKGRTLLEKDKKDSSSDDVPNPLMVLFIGHDQIGNRGWCCKNDAKLLYFILDTVVPRLRSPSLSKCLEQVLQYMEQCVYCLFGHPAKKSKVKYLEDHNVTPHNLDWPRAQQLYEIFRPLSLPELEGKVTAISADTEQLFHRILALMPPECEPQKFVSDLEKYMTGKESKLPRVPPLLPYKMKDIYFILGDYYLKKEECRMSIKYNMYDVLINNDRFESWAQITLAKGVNLERVLNSCNNINSERDFIRPAKTIVRCFKRTLDLGSNCDVWLEYAVFSYSVHSFCSRLLKQASESLSMEDFESLEKHKDEMLDTAQKSCTTLCQELKHQHDPDKALEGMWLSNYFLGKVAEKRNKAPAVYMDFYLKSLKSLYDAEAIYPSKINYNSPQHYSIEVLELCYRIHATILKYIEQHENKPIPASVGKVFLNSLDEWKNGPFLKKPIKKPVTAETENNEPKPEEVPPQAANILKRSISDAGEKDTSECKRMKLDSAAAKVRRSASYDIEILTPNGNADNAPASTNNGIPSVQPMEIETVVTKQVEDKNAEDPVEVTPVVAEVNATSNNKPVEVISEVNNATEVTPSTSAQPNGNSLPKPKPETKPEAVIDKKEDSSSSSSTSSSSTSSSDSSSDSTSDSSRDSDTSSKSSNDSRPLTDQEVTKIIASCIDALEDCVSRFPLHYKALYRLAHYHFYYKNGKDLERSRDVMLSSFTSRQGTKIGGLFGERKNTNFFNNIWRIPISEIDRTGGFANHMNRCVLLTLEILKEIDDHKTLLDMSLHLQRIPEPDKKYLRDSDREELAQQAFSLCVQSLKGQLTKFSQQPDLKSNAVEKAAFDSLMRDIYRAYQRVQKQPNAKQFTNLLVDGYKLVTTVPITENTNWPDLAFKYCQSMIQTLKQQITQASLEKSQNVQKKQSTKAIDTAKTATVTATSSTSATKVDSLKPTASTASGLPKICPNEMAAAFQTYIPMLNDPVLSQQTAAALSLSYLSNMSALAGYTALQNTLQTSLQNSLQNSFQAEFYRQFLGQSISTPFPAVPPPKKQKRGPKQPYPKITTTATTTVTSLSSTMKGSTSFPSMTSQTKGINSSTSTQKAASKSYNSTHTSTSKPGYTSAAHSKPNPTSAHTTISKSYSSYTKPNTTSVITSLHKAQSAPLVPSMGTVLPTLPASLTATLTSTYSQSNMPTSLSFSQSGNVLPAHISTSSAKTGYSKPPMPHQQTSPGKTLQEKLAERQKNMPSQSKGNSSAQEIKSSLGRLPSSLTITKTSVNKQPMVHGKKKDNRTLTFSESERPKPTLSSSEIIVLDDDD